MPTYEYRCPDCSTGFEKFQRMSDPPVAECPQCGTASERKISGGAGLLFKGDGFYITDYRSDSYKKAASSDAGASEGKSSDSKSSESKGSDSPKPASGGDSKSSGGSDASTKKSA